MTSNKEISRLLSAELTLRKIRRMAFQIYEMNFIEKEIIIAGIAGEGYALAELIAEILREITDKKIWLACLKFDKSVNKQPDILIESEVDTFGKKAVILVDDVLNTGKTLAFSLKPFLNIPLKRLQVAVLVDRDHLLFPVKADYVGYSLSTTLKEHVKVILSNKKEMGVYLY